MPDANGICRCNGTGWDGCIPTERTPARTPEEIRLARRTDLFNQITSSRSADPAPLVTAGTQVQLTTAGTHVPLTAQASTHPLLTGPSATPLLDRVVRLDPVLSALLDPDRTPPPPHTP